MPTYARWKTDGDPRGAAQRLLSALLERSVVQAVLVPARHGSAVMPSLVADPRRMAEAEPFAPVVWTNAASLVGALTFEPAGGPIAVMLRSCELRALVELTKLNQARRDELLVIGVDCAGRFENSAFLELDREHDDLGRAFLEHASRAGETAFDARHPVVSACRACERPVPGNVDVRLCWFGADPLAELWLEATSDRGSAALEAAGVPLAAEGPPGRAAAIERIVAERIAFRDALFAAFTEETKDVEGLRAVTASCINCYNCRVACPVCYCRQCVFTTELFRHPGEKYLQWSKRSGLFKMPADTVLYHLTRMVHMSTLCVGCGQCTSACPNGVPVMELFRTMAARAQPRFDYEPGRDFAEPMPLATFHEDELEAVTGQRK